MKKKVIFIESELTEKFPPVVSVLNILSEMKEIELIICSIEPSEYLLSFCKAYNIKLIDVGSKRLDGHTINNLIQKAYYIKRTRYRLWKTINSFYEEGDIIWIHSIAALKLLGKELLKKIYILQLLELVKTVKIYYKIPYFHIDFERYLKCAYRVIECEYNRAHITKAWFGLEALPIILPNKLYQRQEINFDEYHNEKVDILLNSLKGKKIILYQGILGPERPLDKFVQAVSQLDESYALVIMTGDTLAGNIESNNLYMCDYIPAPYHLKVTREAYIGILSYQSAKNGYAQNDVLNSIYCAPNKIYEYSKFGLPMIGNDVPGLKTAIEGNYMGICVSELSAEKIKRAIDIIEKNYDEMRKNAFRFYNSIDISKIVKDAVLEESD